MNTYPDLPSGWFGSDTDAAIVYYAKQSGWNEGTTAQFKKDIKDVIEELETYTFYDDFGGDSAKGFRDRLVEKLKKLAENNT